jgi:hypothetical protein
VDREAVNASSEDWDFAGLGMRDTQSGVHFFHHWTAKFIPQIPGRVIDRYAKPGDVVLDPFMGSGTTLVEAIQRGHDAWGTDINPLAVRIAQAKTTPIDNDALVDFIAWLEEAAGNPSRHLARSAVLFEGGERWFREDVARAIRAIRNRARRLEAVTRNFTLVGLSDLLKGMSNARMDRTVPTLPRSPRYRDKKHYWRLVDNETREIDAFQRLRSQLLRMSRALQRLHESAEGRAEPFLHDARQLSALGRRAQLAITYVLGRALGISEPGAAEIGRRARDYLPDMNAVIAELAGILEGHFALVIGESKEGIHETVRDQCREHGMRLVNTFVRRVKNQAFFAKAVKREFIYVFSTD